MYTLIRKIALAGLYLAAFSSLNYLCKKATHGFNCQKISHPLVSTVSPLPLDLEAIQNQKLLYLGKGAQAFVFVSEDRKYVVKFLRFDHLLAKPFIRAMSFLPLPYIRERLDKSKREIQELCESFELAHGPLSSFTQTLHVHFDSLIKPLHLIDRLGIAHELTNAPFVVQPYAHPFYEKLNTFSEEEVKATIHQLALFLKTRFEQGIYDDDPNLETNFGFIDSTLVEFDIGRFEKTDRYFELKARMEDAQSLAKPLKIWLAQHMPHLQAYLENRLTQAYSL